MDDAEDRRPGDKGDVLDRWKKARAGSSATAHDGRDAGASVLAALRGQPVDAAPVPPPTPPADLPRSDLPPSDPPRLPRREVPRSEHDRHPSRRVIATAPPASPEAPEDRAERPRLSLVGPEQPTPPATPAASPAASPAAPPSLTPQEELDRLHREAAQREQQERDRLEQDSAQRAAARRATLERARLEETERVARDREETLTRQREQRERELAALRVQPEDDTRTQPAPRAEPAARVEPAPRVEVATQSEGDRLAAVREARDQARLAAAVERSRVAEAAAAERAAARTARKAEKRRVAEEKQARERAALDAAMTDAAKDAEAAHVARRESRREAAEPDEAPEDVAVDEAPPEAVLRPEVDTRSYQARYPEYDAPAHLIGRQVMRRRRGGPLVTLILLATAAATAAFGTAAWREPTTATVGIAGVLAGLMLVVWAVRASSTPTVVVVDHGVLEVHGRRGYHRFDLAGRHTRVEVVGEPGQQRRWQVRLKPHGQAPFVLDSSDVDGAQLIAAIRRWRPDL